MGIKSISLSLAILFFFAGYSSYGAISIEDDALIIVHGSKHYHTDQSTIEFSNLIAEKFLNAQKSVIALSQKPIHGDQLWYVEPSLITKEISSRMGEHKLIFTPRSQFHVSLIGGYQSACLSRALADLVSNSFKNFQVLNIRLFTRGIFTGFQFKNGKLFPSVDEESWADSSVDGLNLYEVTQNLTHHEWESFIKDSLRVSLFKKRAFKQLNTDLFNIEVYRNSKKIFEIKNQHKSPKVIRIHYDDTNNL